MKNTFKSEGFTILLSEIAMMNDPDGVLCVLMKSGHKFLIFNDQVANALEISWFSWLEENEEKIEIAEPLTIKMSCNIKDFEEAENTLQKALNDSDIALFHKYHTNLSSCILDTLNKNSATHEDIASIAATKFLNIYRSGKLFNVAESEEPEYASQEQRKDLGNYMILQSKIASYIYDEFEDEECFQGNKQWLSKKSQETAKRFLDDLVGVGKLKQTFEDADLKASYRQAIINQVAEEYIAKYPDLTESENFAQAIAGKAVDMVFGVMFK